MSKKQKIARARAQQLFSAIPTICSFHAFCSYSQSDYVAREIKNLIAAGLSDSDILDAIPKSEAFKKEVAAIEARRKAVEEEIALKAEKLAIRAQNEAIRKERMEMAQAISTQYKPGLPHSRAIRDLIKKLCLEGKSEEEVTACVQESPLIEKRRAALEQLRLARIQKAQRIAAMHRNRRVMGWGRIPVKVIKFPSPTPVKDLLKRMEAEFAWKVKDAIAATVVWNQEQKAAAAREKHRILAEQRAAEQKRQREEEERIRREKEEKDRQDRRERLDSEADMEEAQEYVLSIIPRERIDEFKRWFVRRGDVLTPLNLMEGADTFKAFIEPPPAPEPVPKAPKVKVIVEQLPAVPPAPKRADVELTGDIQERTVRQRDAGKQKAFKELLIENFGGRCAITGKYLNGVLEAAHIEHGIRNNASNGILMAPTFHVLFDRHLMGINPETMTVHFKPGIEWEEYEGKVISPLMYALDKERLAARWALFQGGEAQ